MNYCGFPRDTQSMIDYEGFFEIPVKNLHCGNVVNNAL